MKKIPTPRTNAPNVAGDLRTAGIPIAVSMNAKSALLSASAKGDIDILKSLFADEDTNLDERDKKGQTALMLAAFNGRMKTVKFLLEKGADVNAKNDDGYTASILAAKRGKTATVRLLDEANAAK